MEKQKIKNACISPEQEWVLYKKGTEPPFSGKYFNHHENGLYVCAGCGTPLFSSEAKYDSGSGWPSFYKAINDGNILMQQDLSHGMRRTEIICANCGGHLGHLFNDGPEPTGERYCVNSLSLNFKKDNEQIRAFEIKRDKKIT